MREKERGEGAVGVPQVLPLPGYVCLYVCMYLHTYVPTYLRTYVPMYVPTYPRTYLRAYVRAYVCTYARMPHVRAGGGPAGVPEVLALAGVLREAADVGAVVHRRRQDPQQRREGRAARRARVLDGDRLGAGMVVVGRKREDRQGQGGGQGDAGGVLPAPWGARAAWRIRRICARAALGRVNSGLPDTGEAQRRVGVLGPPAEDRVVLGRVKSGLPSPFPPSRPRPRWDSRAAVGLLCRRGEGAGDQGRAVLPAGGTRAIPGGYGHRVRVGPSSRRMAVMRAGGASPDAADRRGIPGPGCAGKSLRNAEGGTPKR